MRRKKLPDIDWEDINKKRLKTGTRVLIGFLTILLAAAGIYMGGVFFFKTHFFPNTKIHGIHVSLLNEGGARNAMSHLTDEYELQIFKKGNYKSYLEGTDIDLKTDTFKTVNDCIKTQDVWQWPKQVKENHILNIYYIDYDHEKLKEYIERMDTLSTTDGMKTKSASISKQNGIFYITPEVTGDSLDLEKTQDVIDRSIHQLQIAVSLEGSKCYGQPEYTQESPEFKEALDIARKSTKSSITYQVDGYRSVYLTQAIINSWIYVENDIQIKADIEKIHDFVNKLQGMYPIEIDEDKEIKQIVTDIKSGKDVYREPEWKEGKNLSDARS